MLAGRRRFHWMWYNNFFKLMSRAIENLPRDWNAVWGLSSSSVLGQLAFDVYGVIAPLVSQNVRKKCLGISPCCKLCDLR